MVNRDGWMRPLPNPNTLMEITVQCNTDTSILVDAYHGIVFDEFVCAEGQMTGNVTIEANGYGALVMVEALDEELMDFLAIMNEMTITPLGVFDDTWSPLTQTMEDPEKFVRRTWNLDQTGEAEDLETVMVEGGDYSFYSVGNFIEGDRLPHSCGVQFPWETNPRRSHQHIMYLPGFKATKYPITNGQYKQFLEETNWEPRDSHNWLRHWGEASSYPEGFEKKPVTWVSVTDAETFCAYYGMATPTPWQWQWMAQGPEDNNYPWGNEEDPARVPQFSSARDMPAPDDVDAHPDGASWCGVEDLVGNVYSWSRVFTDDHTSRAVIRGGSRWRPEGSHWYQPRPGGGPVVMGPVIEHNTYLLMDDSLDRSGGIGFRCVQEVTLPPFPME